MGSILVDKLEKGLFPDQIISSAAIITLDTLDLATHRSFEWSIRVEDEADSKTIARKLLAVYNGLTIKTTEFARKGDNGMQIVLSVIKDGADMKLQLDNNTGNELKIDIVRLGKYWT